MEIKCVDNEFTILFFCFNILKIILNYIIYVVKSEKENEKND